jgi:hypothetical protein
VLFWLNFVCDNLVHPCNTLAHRSRLSLGPLTATLAGGGQEA